MKARLMEGAALAVVASLGCVGATSNDDVVTTIQAAIVNNTADFSESPIANPVNLSGTRVRALHVDGSRVFVGGTFSFTSGANTFSNLAAFDLPSNPSSAPTLVTGFRPNPNGAVWALASNGTSLYVGGEFTSIAGSSRTRLAAVNRNTGALVTAFSANVSGNIGCPTCTSGQPNFGNQGVHALSVTFSNFINGNVLAVGGNFTTVTHSGSPAASRSGLAAVDLANGTVSPDLYPTGVTGGFVSSLRDVPEWGLNLIGGTFNAYEGLSTGHLISTTVWGDLYVPYGIFDDPVLDVDADVAGQRVYAAIGGVANHVLAFPAFDVDALWGGPTVCGDVQTLHFFNGAVYFGFHDGMFVNGSGGNKGDRFKLAAIDATNGNLLADKSHPNATCDAAHTGDCWAPLADPTAGFAGFFGLWRIKHFTSASGTRLLVGGEVNQWNGVGNTRFFTSFGP